LQIVCIIEKSGTHTISCRQKNRELAEEGLATRNRERINEKSREDQQERTRTREKRTEKHKEKETSRKSLDKEKSKSKTLHKKEDTT
jgi:hypothetical protein